MKRRFLIFHFDLFIENICTTELVGDSVTGNSPLFAYNDHSLRVALLQYGNLYVSYTEFFNIVPLIRYEKNLRRYIPLLRMTGRIRYAGGSIRWEGANKSLRFHYTSTLIMIQFNLYPWSVRENKPKTNKGRDVPYCSCSLRYGTRLRL